MENHNHPPRECLKEDFSGSTSYLEWLKNPLINETARLLIKEVGKNPCHHYLSKIYLAACFDQ